VVGRVSGRDALAVRPECICNAADLTLGVDQEKVETNPCPAPVGVGGQGNFGGFDDAALLAGLERCGCGSEGWAGFHFNDGEEAFALGDDVQLPGWGAEAAGKDGPAFGLEGGFGLVFGLTADAVGCAASGLPGQVGWFLGGYLPGEAVVTSMAL